LDDREVITAAGTVQAVQRVFPSDSWVFLFDNIQPCAMCKH